MLFTGVWVVRKPVNQSLPCCAHSTPRGVRVNYTGPSELVPTRDNISVQKILLNANSIQKLSVEPHPLGWDTPHVYLGRGPPPPPIVVWTDTQSENINFPHPLDAGGNNIQRLNNFTTYLYFTCETFNTINCLTIVNYETWTGLQRDKRCLQSPNKRAVYPHSSNKHTTHPHSPNKRSVRSL